VWIAVLGSMKVFPNLEAAGLGVFNRVLKNLRKASARFHSEVRFRECSRKLLAILAFTQTPAAHTKVSHARSSCQNANACYTDAFFKYHPQAGSSLRGPNTFTARAH
jgi:hypothetical protein